MTIIDRVDDLREIIAYEDDFEIIRRYLWYKRHALGLYQLGHKSAEFDLYVRKALEHFDRLPVWAKQLLTQTDV